MNRIYVSFLALFPEGPRDFNQAAGSYIK